MRFLLFAILLGCLPTAMSRAAELYVDNVVGDDRADGRSHQPEGHRTGPTRTIQRALDLARKSDRVIVANTGVPYFESISLCEGKQWGRATRPFEIVGNGAILDGTAPTNPENWRHVDGDVFEYEPEWLSSQMLFLEGKPAVRRKRADNGRWPPLEPLEWRLRRGRIHFRVEANKIPENYPLRYAARQTGITLYHVRHVKISNLIVQGFALDGVNAHDGVAHARLENVTARGNGRSGISIGGSSRLAMRECTIGDNGEAQLRTEGYSIALLRDSLVVDNTAPALDIDGGEFYFDGERIEPGEPLYDEAAE